MWARRCSAQAWLIARSSAPDSAAVASPRVCLSGEGLERCIATARLESELAGPSWRRTDDVNSPPFTARLSVPCSSRTGTAGHCSSRFVSSRDAERSGVSEDTIVSVDRSGLLKAPRLDEAGPSAAKEPLTDLGRHLQHRCRASRAPFLAEQQLHVIDSNATLQIAQCTVVAVFCALRIRMGGGPITVAEFMTTCLASPKGYYPSGDVFGAKGDFVTSPEISQMFGWGGARCRGGPGPPGGLARPGRTRGARCLPRQCLRSIDCIAGNA